MSTSVRQWLEVQGFLVATGCLFHAGATTLGYALFTPHRAAPSVRTGV